MDHTGKSFDCQQGLLALCFYSVCVWPESAEKSTRLLVELGVSYYIPR